MFRNTIERVLVDVVFLQVAGVIWAFSVVSRMRSILEGKGQTLLVWIGSVEDLCGS